MGHSRYWKRASHVPKCVRSHSVHDQCASTAELREERVWLCGRGTHQLLNLERAVLLRKDAVGKDDSSDGVLGCALTEGAP
jgi:hypothetical protein